MVKSKFLTQMLFLGIFLINLVLAPGYLRKSLIVLVLRKKTMILSSELLEMMTEKSCLPQRFLLTRFWQIPR